MHKLLKKVKWEYFTFDYDGHFWKKNTSFWPQKWPEKSWHWKKTKVVFPVSLEKASKITELVTQDTLLVEFLDREPGNNEKILIDGEL